MSVAHRSLDELFVELLDRAIAVADADSASVFLVEGSGTELIARAARGFEAEARQGDRMRIGEGLAGRVAAEGRRAVIDCADATDISPILWQHGVRALVGVPLVAGETIIGVLQVGSTTPGRFAEAAAAALSAVADQIAPAVHVRLLEADRDAAEAVQRSLMPSAPASVGAFDCAARHVPAGRGGIGGDWYDVFALDTGEVWMIVGDVAGHGLRAATVMGRVRSAMRAFALVGQGPDGVLALTHRKMTHFEVGSLVTVALARSRPPYDDAEVAVAGHPPLVRAIPGRPAELVVAEPGPPLGVDFGSRPGSVQIEIPTGSVLVGYTDGLVERRGELLDVGFERVRSAVTASNPDEVCERVMASAIGDRVPEDDVALITLRRH